MPAPAGAEVRDRLRIVSRTPSLRGALARNSGATTDAIAGALRSRGVPQRDAHIAAAATIGALNAALLEWADGDDPDLGSAIEAALRVLAGGGSTMTNPALAVHGVTRRFRNGAGVFDLDLELRAGQIVALVGLNGAGKSTMMRILLGMLRPDGGEVTTRGIPARRSAARNGRRWATSWSIRSPIPS